MHKEIKSSKLYKTEKNWFQIIVILTLSIATCTGGVMFTWTSPSIPILIADDYPEKITLEQASYLVMIPPLAGIPASFIFPFVMDKIGRKKTLLSVVIPYLLSQIIIICTKNIIFLYISRFFSGFADTALFTVMPSYMGEITTPRVRGSWGNVPTVAIYFGQILMNSVGGYNSITITACIFTSLPILFLLTFINMPESPYYLIMKSRHEEAKRSLQVLRRKKYVEEELKQLVSDVHRQTSEPGTWKDLFVNPTHRRALIAGIFIRGAQQFSGLAAFSTYTVFLFQQAGSNLSPTIASIIFVVLLTITNAVGSIFLDKLGRRLAMIISCAGSAVTLLAESAYFYLQDNTNFDVQSISIFPVVILFINVIISGIGLGIVPTLIIGELFSASIKAKGVCALQIGFCLYMSLIPKLYQYFTSNFGRFTPFLLFGVCCFFSIFISYRVIPETRGKTLEEIQQDIKKSSDE